MNRTGSLYIEQESLFHRLQGSIKLVMLLLWTIFIFMFMDLRIFLGMTILGFVGISLAKIPIKRIRPLVLFVVMFTVFNALFLILVTPQHGSKLAGSYTIFMELGNWKLTWETLFFALTLSLKYLSILPITLLFVFTTHPSKFAGSLHKIGISYRVAYAVNIALRYIPDVTEEMRNIMNAQEARGVSFNKKDASLGKRLRNYMVILVPLMMSSLNRVEVVSNAMDLRGFGRSETRTWYNDNSYGKIDFIFLGCSCLLIVLGIWLKGYLNTPFWYPF